nr:hypothetical protein [uncultured Oscillibacter sp.]
MSILSEIERIKENLEDAYTAVAEKGGRLPEKQVSGALAAAVRSIPAGGGTEWVSGYDKDFTLWTSVLKLFPARQPVLCEGSYEILEKGDT